MVAAPIRMPYIMMAMNGPRLMLRPAMPHTMMAMRKALNRWAGTSAVIRAR
jgi:hypothetical protein